MDIEKAINEHRGHHQEKLLYALKGTVDCLPFSNESFDCYLSNMVIESTHDHKKMIKEAYRVLKKGGVCGFSTVGREENNTLFRIPIEVLEMKGLVEPEGHPF